MKTFLKTFFITLLVCLGVFFYISFNKESYKSEIKPVERFDTTTPFDRQEQPKQKDEVKPKTIKIALMTKSGDIKFVNRTANNEGIQTAIHLLLKGPTNDEKEQGLYSEIPVDTRLRWVRESDGDLIINMNEAFAAGGGTESVMARIDQLVKTVRIYNADSPVYLYLEGKKVEYIGGEGVYLKQPLN